MKKIRNFCIISHIDHGKSTLADRFLEITGAVSKEKLKAQFLDSLIAEKEHGITVKEKAVRLDFSGYLLNLVDTPGHVDFSFEVKRAIWACEGAILLVDGTKGVQAQTLANFHLAKEAGLKIIPVISKIDLSHAQLPEIKNQIEDSFGFEKREILAVSGKTGEDVESLLEEIIKRIPPPRGDVKKPFSALVFDSSFDPYKGIVLHVKVACGKIQKGEKIFFLRQKTESEVQELGYFCPDKKNSDRLLAGEIGFITSSLKDPSQCQIGDTIVLASEKNQDSLIKVDLPKPNVFFSLFPQDPTQFLELKNSLEKLRLTDSSLDLTPEFSQSLGQGFRIGFLGVLHAQIVQERLEEEFGVLPILTSPNVNYQQDGKIIKKVEDFDATAKETFEPWVRVFIFTPQEFLGQIITLIHSHRAKGEHVEYFGRQAKIEIEMPLLEVISGLYDKLKSTSQGFASMDYEDLGYRKVEVVRLDVLIAGQKVDALSQIVPREKSTSLSRSLTQKLKEVIPKQQFEVPIQVAVGSKIIARETISAFRKDVTQKLYGGDVTRKRKLLEKQKKGKKRMRKFGNVDIPQEAFLAVLKI